jgi:hypothetical protein
MLFALRMRYGEWGMHICPNSYRCSNPNAHQDANACHYFNTYSPENIYAYTHQDTNAFYYFNPIINPNAFFNLQISGRAMHF